MVVFLCICFLIQTLYICVHNVVICWLLCKLLFFYMGIKLAKMHLCLPLLWAFNDTCCEVYNVFGRLLFWRNSLITQCVEKSFGLNNISYYRKCKTKFDVQVFHDFMTTWMIRFSSSAKYMFVCFLFKFYFSRIVPLRLSLKCCHMMANTNNIGYINIRNNKNITQNCFT